MNKYFQSFVIIAMSFFLMGFECEDHYSSQNGPYYQGIDTTEVTYLKTPANVNMSVLVVEYDSSVQKNIEVEGAVVKSNNSLSIDTTNSTGDANIIFQTDSIPFKFSFEVDKKGYNKIIYNGWGEKLEMSVLERITKNSQP